MSAPAVVITPDEDDQSPPSILMLWSGSYRGTTLAIFTLMFLTAFEALAVTTAMPTVVADLGGIALYGIAFAAPMATGVIAMTISGWWNDRSGPARPILTGVTLFAAGLIVAGFASNMMTIVLGRGLQGLGAGLLGVSLYVMIGHAYDERLRPRMFTILTGAWILPALIGPAIAGFVTEHLGWRWLFLGVPFLAAGATAIMLSTLRSLPDRSEIAARTELGRKPLWAVATAIAIVVLNRAGQRDDTIWPLLLVASLLVLGVSIPRLLPPGTWRGRRGIPAIVALRGLIGAAFVGTEVYLPLLLKEERGLSASLAGFVLTSGALSWFVGSWIAGLPEHRLTTPTRIRLGNLSLALGIVAAASTLNGNVPVFTAAIGWAFAGLGMGLVYPILSTITLATSKPEEQGVNSSALQINESLSSSIVLALGGAIFASLLTTSTNAAYLTSFAISLVLALVAATIAPRIESA